MHFLTGVCAIIGGIFTGKDNVSEINFQTPSFKIFITVGCH